MSLDINEEISGEGKAAGQERECQNMLQKQKNGIHSEHGWSENLAVGINGWIPRAAGHPTASFLVFVGLSPGCDHP